MNYRCWHAMSSNMTAPYKTQALILEMLKFLNYSYFAKIMTRRPRHGNLTKALSISGVTKVASAIKGILWWRDVTWKPRIVSHFWLLGEGRGDCLQGDYTWRSHGVPGRGLYMGGGISIAGTKLLYGQESCTGIPTHTIY